MWHFSLNLLKILLSGYNYAKMASEAKTDLRSPLELLFQEIKIINYNERTACDI